MKVDWVGDDLIRCSVCGEVKPKELFPFSTSNSRSGYYFSYCKVCRGGRLRENRLKRDPWVEKTGKVKLRAKKLGLSFDLDVDFMRDLFESQDGMCFYTGYEMILTQGQGLTQNTASLDKLIPELGYTMGNVVFCTQRANTIKNNMSMEELAMWMPSWHSKIVEFLS